MDAKPTLLPTPGSPVIAAGAVAFSVGPHGDPTRSRLSFLDMPHLPRSHLQLYIKLAHRHNHPSVKNVKELQAREPPQLAVALQHVQEALIMPGPPELRLFLLLQHYLY